MHYFPFLQMFGILFSFQKKRLFIWRNKIKYVILRQINLTKGNDVFSDYQPRNAITLKIITIYYEKTANIVYGPDRYRLWG